MRTKRATRTMATTGQESKGIGDDERDDGAEDGVEDE